MKQSKKIIAAKIASIILVFPSGSIVCDGRVAYLEHEQKHQAPENPDRQRIQSHRYDRKHDDSRTDNARNPFVSATAEQRVDDVAAVELSHGKKIQRRDEQRAPRGPINRIPLDPPRQMKQHH